jgi:ligand-binding sensor domain-containing protein
MLHYKPFPLFLFSLLLFTSCNSSSRQVLPTETSAENSSMSKAGTSFKYGPGDVVTKGYLDRSGNIWFLTTAEGIFKYDGETFHNYTVKDGLCGNEVWSVAEDEDGVLCFGTANGLCKFHGNTFENIPIPDGESNSDWLESMFPHVNPKAVSSLLQDKNGVFWIGSNGAGAYRYDGKEFRPFLKKRGNLMPDSLHHNTIVSIVEDQKGDIWFGSFSHGGVSQYDGSTFIHHALKDGIGDGMISSLYIDRKGVLWVGTRNGGIFYFDGSSFINVPDAKTGEQIAMATFLEDSSGNFWVASYARKGVYLFDGNSFLPLEIEGGDKLVDIKCISEDKDGNAWFGGRYGALWRYDGKQLTDFTYKKRT